MSSKQNELPLGARPGAGEHQDRTQEIAKLWASEYGVTDEEALWRLHALRDSIDGFLDTQHSQTELWMEVYWKIEEAEYFLDMLRAHVRNPKPMLFYISAFLSAARSITFHVQKQILPSVPGGRKLYEAISDRYLHTPLCELFRDLRNMSEKEMYLRLAFTISERCYDESGNVVWVARGGSSTYSPRVHWLSFVQSLLNRIYPRTSEMSPLWYIKDTKEHEWPLLTSCEGYMRQLRDFTEELRRITSPSGFAFAYPPGVSASSPAESEARSHTKPS